MGRRGFASIDRLPSGSWRIRWTVQGVKHHEVLPKTCKKREVERRAAELEVEYGRLAYGTRIPTVSELFERDVWPTIATGKDTTVEAYKYAWKKVAAKFGGLSVSKLNAAVVQDWLIENPSNSHHALVVLRKVSTRAAQLGYTGSDRLAVKISTSAAHRERKVADDPAAYMRAVEGSPIEGAVLLMLGAGLRVGEALAVDLNDIDLECGTIAVVNTVGEDCGELKGRTKTKESTRVVAISPDIAQRFTTVVEAARARGDHYLCDDGFGRAIGKKLARSVWDRLTAKLPRVTMQQLRPTFATRMLNAGQSERATNIAMGHKSLSQVLQQYDRPEVVIQPPKLY